MFSGIDVGFRSSLKFNIKINFVFYYFHLTTLQLSKKNQYIFIVDLVTQFFITLITPLTKRHVN